MAQGSIRAYRPADRPTVRRICCDTGDGGGPIDSFFWDRDLFADLLTAYYTDYEPESLWVAEAGGAVVGYLSGCLSTERFLRLLRWPLAPLALARAVFRKRFWSARCLGFVRANAMLWLREGSVGIGPRRLYPAHLHVNLVPECRGLGLGGRLVESFLEHARRQRRCGVHASVAEDNASGRAFFEHLGFGPAQTLPLMVRPDSGRLVRRASFLLSFVRANALFGDFAPIEEPTTLRVAPSSKAGQASPLAKSLPAPYAEEGALGTQWRTVGVTEGRVVLRMAFARPIGRQTSLTVHLFGWRKDVAFTRMPKITLVSAPTGAKARDGDRRLRPVPAEIRRATREIVLSVPLSALGDPQRVLLSARATLAELPLDPASWDALVVPGARP